MQLSVSELIEELKKMPQNALVTRGDADWGNVKVTEVRNVRVNDLGDSHAWEVYDENQLPDEDDNYVWMVKVC